VDALANSPIGEVNEAAVETVGWPELVDQVAGVLDELPADERAHVMILTATYGEAGAIDRFGPGRGLPAAYSPHNHYWYFREPTDDDATVIAVRFSLNGISRWFEHCDQIGAVDNGLDIDNEVQGTPIVVCRGLRQPWAVTWPQMKHLS
jgi:hypothetical protein